MFILNNQVNHVDINEAVIRWGMARWNVLRRCADKPAAVREASLEALQTCIVNELVKNFPHASKNSAFVNRLCDFAGRLVNGL